MRKNELKDKKIAQKKGEPDQRQLSFSTKTGQTTAPPLMTKTHYSFEEAFRFVKSLFPSFTHENLLNHGFQSDISFIIKVPAEVKVYNAIIIEHTIFGTRAPSFLTISPFDCEEIERNGSVQLSMYSRGYYHDEVSMFMESLPNYDPNSNAKPLWKTSLNDEEYGINISAWNLLIIHSSLLELVAIIKLRLSNNLNPQIRYEILRGNTPIKFHSLSKVVSQLTDCKQIDLLRRAIQRNITLLIRVPTEITVRSSISTDYSSGVEYQLRPHFLELKALDCENIYYDESAWVLDFPVGYFNDSTGHIKRITPIFERHWLADKNPSWRTYQGNVCTPLRLICEHLYVNREDVKELMDQDESQDLKIPKESIKLLSNYGFISMERAVEIAKLKYQKCTINHLFRLGSRGVIKIVTPIPSAIRVHKYSVRKEKKTLFYNPIEYPVLLILYIGTCKELEKNLILESGIFDSAYYFFENGFVDKSATEPNIWGLVTYLENKPHGIELMPDRLYVNKSILLKMLESESALWNDIDQILIKEAEDRKLEHEALEPKNVNTSATDETNSQLLVVDPGVQSDNQHEGEEKACKLLESPPEDIKFLSRIEVLKCIECLHIKKSTMANRMNKKSDYYDPDFPLPTTVGRGKKLWVASKVKAYLLLKRHTASGPVG